MTKDQIIAELFFRFRCAKRLLQIDHPICQFCGNPSVGCHTAYLETQIIIGRCEEHWEHVAGLSPILWRVRWDEMEDAKEITLSDIYQEGETPRRGRPRKDA